MSKETFLWVEKYRPKKITDCILPESIKNTFIEFVGQKEIPNLLLSGGSGVGKTTVARALCEELHADYILINGSEESGIDVLRNKIKQFASTVSLQSGSKVVILMKLIILIHNLLSRHYEDSLKNSIVTAGLFLPVILKTESLSHYILGVR